jgi:ATP-dependent Clp protease ATP-binding subunit ClpC
MFERYTERARRVLFFARYEASQLGRLAIEPHHLMLGLLREGKGITSRILANAKIDFVRLRAELESRSAFQEKVSTSVEIPFDEATKRVLMSAPEEADRFNHDYIGTEHLLLGILRDEGSELAELLNENGLALEKVRSEIASILNEGPRLDRDQDVCCFCGKPLSFVTSDAVTLQVLRPGQLEGGQTLHAHVPCLQARVIADIVLFPDENDG